ncbi:MAG: hypothetical protein M3159_08350 [Actinomycetota bacterium]|nr:hypothetical protein [Actinomycetota bacterium]
MLSLGVAVVLASGVAAGAGAAAVTDDDEPPDASRGAAAAGLAEPAAGTNVPDRCHWPVKLLNGPPTIWLVHSSLNAPLDAS